MASLSACAILAFAAANTFLTSTRDLQPARFFSTCSRYLQMLSVPVSVLVVGVECAQHSAICFLKDASIDAMRSSAGLFGVCAISPALRRHAASMPEMVDFKKLIVKLSF